jgi:stearoyl-CoA desaturase (delta-9 desaturase)
MAGLEDDDDAERVNSLIADRHASPVEGRVRWDPVHSSWNGGMMAATLLLAVPTFSFAALGVFIVMTGATLLFGHSVGFHRLMIHGSFKSPLWLERTLSWFGTLVGMSGPLWMIRTHDLRDWAQRQADCHPYLAHRSTIWRDAIWQLHCRLVLKSPPRFDLGRIGRDPVHRFLERTWMLQQLPLAGLLYLAGGWGFVIWGICARVCVSVTGHWFIGHLAHRRGPQSQIVMDAGVQAHDVPWAAIPTMGEAWHNNHHAYPGSARIGIYPGQSDWGFALIRVLEWLGLAWEIRLPEDMPDRTAKLLPAKHVQRSRCPALSRLVAR